MKKRVSKKRFIPSEEQFQKSSWEIDYIKADYKIIEDNKLINPFLFAIVCPEIGIVAKFISVNENDNYLSIFRNAILATLGDEEFYPTKVLVRKKDLYDLLQEILKDEGIEVRLLNKLVNFRELEYDLLNMFKIF